MSVTDWVQFLILVVAVLVTAPPLGRYMAAVYGDPDARHPGRRPGGGGGGDGGGGGGGGGPDREAGVLLGPRPAPGDRVFLPVERLVYRLCRVDPAQEQRWTVYAYSVLGFSLVSLLVLYVLQRLQGSLPANPLGLPGVDEHLSFNTAVSFMTNTNWQSYAGETTLSHLTQMMGLTVQNFVSPAAGAAVMAALIRGLARRQASTLGNFWVDLTRSTTRVLLPLSFVVALVLVSQGVVQNFQGLTEVRTLQGATQLIPGGPAASQVAIKQLGTNGGGFFNVNAAHPFENPTGLSDLVEVWALVAIPFALAFTYGRMVRDRRQGWLVFGVMFAIWAVMSVGAVGLETAGNPRLTDRGADQDATGEQAGGNMEGKEVRIGSANSARWLGATTGSSNGAVNSMLDSATPLGGGIAMGQMMLGEVSPGGVGVGLNGVLINVILSVFVAGLMVGRTPEYLGKKIQAAEMKLVVLYVLAMPATVLSFSAASVLLDTALASRANEGPHGLSEILYAFTSTANNNGSAFAGLTAATQWYDTTLGLAMLFGRFFLIIPVLAIAGSMVRKQALPTTAGTFPTHTPLFGGLVVGVIVIVAGLTFFPALALGPIVEQLSL